ncbi:MAG TPA: TonB-dependent receptor, partial [Acidobacteriota bacterium]|nr:TonB-dependent receptor [Acidobacteriota bacterium]
MRKGSSGLCICILVATAILLWGYGALQAQSIQYGKITGKITDGSGVAIPGAQVELTSTALFSGKRLTNTSQTGTYVFLNLPVGTYRIAASLPGFKTAFLNNVDVGGGSVATVDIVMEFGDVSESVTVSGETPIVDTKTSTVEAKFDDTMLKGLPTARDPFYDLALTAPGIFSAGKDASWLPSPTAYGSGTNENSFLVDGVNATDPRGASWGSLVNVNYDAVEEVRVIALGSKAEYGSSTGAAVDVLTKSGSNNYHGRASFYGQLGKPQNNSPQPGDNLGADWLILDPTSDLFGRTLKDREMSFTIGGPIKKDKVWFFGAADLSNVDNKEPLWPVTETGTNRFFDFKVSAQPMQNHTAWISYHFERNGSTGNTWGNDVPWDSTLQYANDTSNSTISAQWQWLPNSKSILTAKYLGFRTKWDPSLPSNAPAYPGYVNWWKWQDFGVNGAFPYIETHDATRHTVQADMSQYVEDFLGQQDIKFGVQYTTGHGNDMGGYFQGYYNAAYPYRWTQNISYLQDWYGDTGMLWYVEQRHIPPFETARTYKQTGAFMDDQWSISSRLTLNLGLRFDNMSNRYGTGKVFAQPADQHFNIDSLQVVRDRAGTGNVFDFNNWSPRIGGTYALTDDSKTVIRANFGRYYAPVGLENLRRLGPDMPQGTIDTLFYNIPFDQVDLNHNGVIDPEEVTTAARLLRGLTPYDQTSRVNDPSWRAVVAPGTKNQFVDQWTLNFEREVVKDLSFAATYIHKRTGNILVQFPLNRATGKPFDYERVPYTTRNGSNVDLYSIVLKDYNGDGVTNGADIDWISQNTDFQMMNLPSLDGKNPERTYDGLQFVVNKRFSNRVQMLGSFLYSTSNGPANRNNFQDWNIEGPMIMDTGWFRSLNASINNMEGPLPFTPKYEFKLSGSYMVPKIETDFGMRLRFATGRPYWFLEEIPIIASYNFDSPPPGGVIDPDGSPIIVGVDPNNPKILPSSTIVDLRFSKSFSVASSQSVIVDLDCFNIFNNNSVTNANYDTRPGVVTAVTAPSRKFRLG